MSQPLEPTQEDQILGDYAEALAEAEQRGFTYNPDSLEDITYDADDIRAFLKNGGTDAEHSGNYFDNGVTGY